MYLSRLRQALLATTVLFFAPDWIHADTLTMVDGSMRTGRIVDQKTEFITFEDAKVGVIRIAKSQVSKVDVTSSGPQGISSTVNELEFARAEKNRGRSSEALLHYVKAAAGDNSRNAAAEFHAYFQQVFQDGVRKIKTTPDQARDTLRGLYVALSQPESQKLFEARESPKSYPVTAEEVSANLAEANYQLARRMENNTALTAQVQELLKEAVILSKNQNPEHLRAYGEAARNNNDLETAFAAFRTLVQSGKANKDQLTVAYERLDRIASATNGRLKMQFATPTPSAVPSVVTPTPITMQSTQYPGPNVVQSSPKPVLPWWKEALESIKSGEIVNDISAFFSPPILMALAGLVAAFVLLWWLPLQFLKFKARRGDTVAGEKLYGAKKLGPLALGSYLFKRISEKKSARHRCPFCNRGIDNMEDYKDLNFVVCPHCREPITPIYEMRDYVEHLIQQLQLSQKASQKGHKGDALIEKDAMLKLVRGVLALAVRRRASDFHLETLNEGGKVRARIDGIMYELIQLPREITPAFISAIKVMAQLDITERRVPQDGKIALWLDQKDYDLRVNTSPASMGEKVVIRILRQDSINIGPEKLGLDGENLLVFERNINKPHGVIIVTGPSGSGKSTSLYVALNQLNSGDKNIVTIEDPIEYQLQGLSQMQVNPGANFTFANGLRSILRQDPDVIMVGEIRDKETAEAALDAAMTGHLVLTTLHTIDAPSAFSRMHDLGIEQARVANAVNLVVAQRLVRTICPDCRKTYKPKAADLQKLGITGDDDITYVHGTGCDTCMNTGFYGRLAVFEMLELNDALRSLLETQVATTALREAAKKHGLRTLREEGLRKVAEGVTTVEEVIRVTT